MMESNDPPFKFEKRWLLVDRRADASDSLSSPQRPRSDPAEKQWVPKQTKPKNQSTAKERRVPLAKRRPSEVEAPMPSFDEKRLGGSRPTKGPKYLRTDWESGLGPHKAFEEIDRGLTKALETLLEEQSPKEIQFLFAMTHPKTSLSLVHAAAQSGSAKILAILLRYSESRDVPRASNLQTPLHFAKTRFVAELLLAAGFAIDSVDRDGCTPLHRAAENSFGDVVELLVKAGANIHLRDNRNLTALEYCVKPKTQRTLAPLFILGETASNVGVTKVDLSQVKLMFPSLAQLAASALWKATPKFEKSPKWLMSLPAELKSKLETLQRSQCFSCGQICIPRWSFLATYSVTYPSKYPQPRLVHFDFRRPEILCGHNSCFDFEHWEMLYLRSAKVNGSCALKFRCSDLYFDANGAIQTDPDYVAPQAEKKGNEELDDYGVYALSVSKEANEPKDKLEWKVLLMNKWRNALRAHEGDSSTGQDGVGLSAD